MPTLSSAETVRALWAAFDRFEFERAAPLLHDDFICEWPQSRERIRGRDNFIAINRNYPGRWHITVERIVAEEDEVATQCEVTDGMSVLHAVSFFTLRDHKVARILEYWPDRMEAQPWRAQWVERA